MVKDALTITLIRPNGSVERLDGRGDPAPMVRYGAARRTPQERRRSERAPAERWRGRLIDLVG